MTQVITSLSKPQERFLFVVAYTLIVMKMVSIVVDSTWRMGQSHGMRDYSFVPCPTPANTRFFMSR